MLSKLSSWLNIYDIKKSNLTNKFYISQMVIQRFFYSAYAKDEKNPSAHYRKTQRKKSREKERN